MFSFSPNTRIKSSQVNQNFTDVAAGDADTNDNSLRLFRAEVFVNFIDAGLIWSQVSGLNGAMSSGVAYIISPAGIMLRLAISSIASRTFTASKDTYVDMDYTGAFFYTEVANGATTGFTLAANRVRLAKVVTNGSAITSITTTGFDASFTPIRNPNPVSATSLFNPYKFHAYLNTAPVVNVGSVIPYATIEYDYANGFNTTTNRYTAPISGFYTFTATYRQSPPAATYIQLEWRVNGSNIAYGSFGYFSGGGSWSTNDTLQIYLNAGDYIQVFSASGGNYTMVAGKYATRFTGCLIGL